MNSAFIVPTSVVVDLHFGFAYFPNCVNSCKTLHSNRSACSFLRSYNPSTFSSSIPLSIQNNPRTNTQRDQSRLSLTPKIHRRGVPRTTFGSASSTTLKQRLCIFLKRFSLEVLIVVILSWISTISKGGRFFSLTSQRSFIVTNISRWISGSLSIRLVLLHSEITSSFPSMSRGEDDDWFLHGSYFVLTDKTDAPVSLRIRQVPGNGSCLFNAIAAGILCYDSSTNTCEVKQHPPMAEVCKLSSKLRTKAVDILSGGILHTEQLIIQKDEVIDASTLVRMAADIYGITSNEYLDNMRDEKVWGGGPEIVALANGLQRQIFVLETLDYNDAASKSHQSSSDGCAIYFKVSACFGPSLEVDDLKPPIYILSANQMFPKGCKMQSRENHFLAVFPSSIV
ncbi:hypothetical protein ACHAW6_003313 [Cyclotella cf. meneghiniana]